LNWIGKSCVRKPIYLMLLLKQQAQHEIRAPKFRSTATVPHG
jgi:hypothetical protein